MFVFSIKMADLHRNVSHVFRQAYEDLGPYPADEDPNASDFAAYCVEKTASELAVGNFVILSSGSWFNFTLEAAFIVHDINRASGHNGSCSCFTGRPRLRTDNCA